MAAVAVSGAAMLRTGLLILLVLLVQSTLGIDVAVGRAHPDLVWLLPITAALVAGPAEGAAVGFASGLAMDLLLPTPFGLSALVGTLIGFAVGVAVRSADRTVWWVAPVAALAGSAGAVMLYAVLGAVLGEEQFVKAHLGAVLAVVAVTNAVLAGPAMPLMRWALTGGASGARRPAGPRW